MVQDHAGDRVEGLVVKGPRQPYQGRVRQWLKVKHWDTIDVVCAAVTGRRDRPAAIIAGLPIGGELVIVGPAAALGRPAATALARHLHTAREDRRWHYRDVWDSEDLAGCLQPSDSCGPDCHGGQ